MARHESFFQNHCALTAIVFAIIAALVAYKTVQTASLPTNTIAANSIELAHKLVNGAQSAPATTNTGVHPTPPGYALALAGLAKINPALTQALSCTKPQFTCTRSAFQFVFIVQYGLALLGLLAILITAWALSRSWSVALMTLMLAFVAGSYGALAGQLTPLIWTQSLMLVSLMCLACGATRNDLRWTLAAGAVLGLTALFMPQLIIVGVITATSLILLTTTRRLNLNHQYGHASAVVVGLIGMVTTACVFMPSSMDLANASLLNLVAQLSERVAFNEVGIRSWITMILAPIPLVEGLSDLLFGSKTALVFQFTAADSSVHRAAAEINAQAHTHGSTPLAQYCWLLTSQVFGNVGSYLAATPGIFMRGLWVGTPILILLGLLHIPTLLRFSHEDLRFGPTLLVAIPVLSLVMINTLVTANRPEYNVGLVFLLTYATAYLIGRTDIRRKFWKETEARAVHETSGRPV